MAEDKGELKRSDSHVAPNVFPRKSVRRRCLLNRRGVVSNVFGEE